MVIQVKDLCIALLLITTTCYSDQIHIVISKTSMIGQVVKIIN